MLDELPIGTGRMISLKNVSRLCGISERKTALVIRCLIKKGVPVDTAYSEDEERYCIITTDQERTDA